jgi:hypothetical protein
MSISRRLSLLRGDEKNFEVKPEPPPEPVEEPTTTEVRRYTRPNRGAPSLRSVADLPTRGRMPVAQVVPDEDHSTSEGAWSESRMIDDYARTVRNRRAGVAPTPPPEPELSPEAARLRDMRARANPSRPPTSRQTRIPPAPQRHNPDFEIQGELDSSNALDSYLGDPATPIPGLFDE